MLNTDEAILADHIVEAHEEIGSRRRAFYARLVERGIAQKPDPSSISLLTDDENAALDARMAALPRLDEELLHSGDLEALLENPLWNPADRALSDDEKRRLHRLVADYRYYTEYSQIDRFWTHVHPAVPQLRNQGDYLEYWAENAVPEVEDAVTFHTEGSEIPGYRRCYYFFPEDYPRLAHHRQVEKERRREAYVEIHALINGE